MKIQSYVITLLAFSFLLMFSNCKSDKSNKSGQADVTSKTNQPEQVDQTNQPAQAEQLAQKSKDGSTLETGWYHVVEATTPNAVNVQLDKSEKSYFLNPQPAMTIEHLKEAFLFSGMTNEEGVKMLLNEKGRLLWTDVTQQAQRKYMGFVIDNVLIVTQRIPGRDDGGQTIFFKKEYSKEKLEAISQKLNDDIKAVTKK